MSARTKVGAVVAAVAAFVGATSLLLSSPSSVAAPDPKAAGVPSLSDLAWMSGSWVTTDGKLRVEEHWTQPSDNVLLGMGRTLQDGRTVFFEYLRIEARADGIFYVAHPAARPGTDFKLTSFDGTEATFENPAHDFPKRIRYRREADGGMTARVDAGGGESKELPQVFKYRKLTD